MWFIGVEVEQETSAPPPKKNPGSAPASHPVLSCTHVLQAPATQAISNNSRSTFPISLYMDREKKIHHC